MENKCCVIAKDDAKKGLLSGIIYGILPHSFCLAFMAFSIAGAITATAIMRKVLLVPNIFYYLVIVSFILATISVYIYLRKTKCLCKSGIKNNWKYISIIYSSTLIINLIFFYGVIPVLANSSVNYRGIEQKGVSEVSIKVDIPCTGHSFLIIQEIWKVKGIADVKFLVPNVFNVKYDASSTAPEQILSLEIFKTYRATTQ